jgi:hypothetical protein
MSASQAAVIATRLIEVRFQQLISKEATWFKFDPHYMPADFCKLQRAVNSPDGGCLVLNHDTPTNFGGRQYNTTEQLLDQLDSPRYRAFCSAPLHSQVSLTLSVSWQAYRSRQAIHIALCFKLDGGVNVCENSTTTMQWLELADNVFGAIESELVCLADVLIPVATTTVDNSCS